MARPTFTVFRILLVLITAALFFGTRAQAQFTLTSLVTTTADPNLKNGWGIAFATGGPFWISDNVTGLSTVYDSTGAIVLPAKS